MLPNVACTYFQRSFKKSVSLKFNNDKYDFSSYIISCALALQHCFVADSAEYICHSCHKCLHSNEHNNYLCHALLWQDKQVNQGVVLKVVAGET